MSSDNFNLSDYLPSGRADWKKGHAPDYHSSAVWPPRDGPDECQCAACEENKPDPFTKEVYERIMAWGKANSNPVRVFYIHPNHARELQESMGYLPDNVKVIEGPIRE